LKKTDPSHVHGLSPNPVGGLQALTAGDRGGDDHRIRIEEESMLRLTLLLALLTSLACASSALAQDALPATDEDPVTKDSPCYTLAGDELRTCLADALQREVKIVLPSCTDADPADADACQVRRTEYQRLLAELTGQPCAGLTGEELQTCDANAPTPKKKGLTRHEGTRMERMEGTGDEDE
jgi:hypothetical protein